MKQVPVIMSAGGRFPASPSTLDENGYLNYYLQCKKSLTDIKDGVPLL